MPIPLPKVSPVQLASRLENGWSDNYGAVRLAAAYAGVECPPRYALAGIWQHGCFGPWYNSSPATLVYNAPGAQSLPVLVARADQAEVLRQHGFAHAQAVGLPILYTPAPVVERIPGSLLVMPTHSLIGEKHPDRAPFERYAATIAQAARHFSKVTVCVHPNCVRNGLWVREFAAHGLEVVFGAEANDANALLRMRTLFAAYETVTTNDWGSHVAYALAFGARVSIHGEPVVSDWRTYLGDLTWAANAASLAHSYSPEVLAHKRQCLQGLYVEPSAAAANPVLGRNLIGAEHQLPPAAMGKLLPTLLRALAPAPSGRAPTAEQRQAARTQARKFAAAGRRQEAVQLLLGFVRAAVDARDPRFIHETLVQIAADLVPLDAPRASALREQADKLSRRLAVAAA